MRRRSRAGEPIKARRRSAVTPKRSNASKARHPRNSCAAAQEKEVAQLARELNEAREQQIATSEVLRIISLSPGDLKPVFEAMLAHALRLCEAKFGHLLLYDGESFRAAHLQNVPSAYRKIWEQGPIRPSPNLALGQIVRAKQVIQITDIKADPAYAGRDPLRVAAVEFDGHEQKGSRSGTHRI